MSINPDQDRITPDQLPPLGPTAEVPLVHRDDVDKKFGQLTEGYDEETAIVPKEHRDDRDQRKGLRRVIASVAGLAVLTVGGVAGAKVLGGNDSPAPSPEQKAGAPANPGEANSPEQAPKPLDFKLDGDKYFHNPAWIMYDFVKIVNEWDNTGATQESGRDPERFTLGDENYAAKLNKASDDAIARDLLVENWRDNPRIVTWYSKEVSVHNTTTVLAMKTTRSGNRENLEQYKRYMDIDGNSVFVEVNDGKQTIVVSGAWHGRDNSDKNNGEEINTGIDPNDEQGNYRLTFSKAADGTMRLSDIDTRADN